MNASQQDTDKLWEMIHGIEIAMMTTEDGGRLRSRPMATAQKAFDGSLWFFTRASAHKTEEVRTDQRVNLSYAHPGKQHYVSVSGDAELVRDRAAIEEHWSEPVRVWFPKGMDDPEIALLRVRVEQAELWDAPSSTVLHLFGYAKAVLTGEAPRNPGDERKISLA